MSGISRFFAPAKRADAETAAALPDVHLHTSNNNPATQEEPPAKKGSKNESGAMTVDGIELDKDGWQIFPKSSESGENDIICIDVVGSDEEDGAKGDRQKPEAKVQAQTAVSMPEELVPQEAAPDEQKVESAEEDSTAKKSETGDISANDFAENKGTDESSTIGNNDVLPETNADETDANAIPTTTPRTDATNPFASFAFDSGGAPQTAQRNNNFKRPLPKPAVTSKDQSKEKDESKVSSAQHEEIGSKKRRRTSTKNKCDSNNYVPVCQLPIEQQEEIRVKWQSLGDPNEPLEIRRFQVLVAARLHAQSREPTVRAAMDNLRKYFCDRKGVTAGEGALDAKSLSKADPKEIAKQIPSILFANVKAEHIVKAAKEVCSRFGGVVPQGTHGLKEITGIGPKLADILAFANSHKAYAQT